MPLLVTGLPASWMIAVLCGCAYLPMIFIGSPAYPVDWALATLLVLVGATVAGSLRLAVRETTQVTDQLRQAASTDPLTGLLNRRGWEATTAGIIAQAHRQSRPLTAVRRLTAAAPRRGSLSVGIAVWDPSEQLSDLLRRTDLALYEAKRAGAVASESPPHRSLTRPRPPRAATQRARTTCRAVPWREFPAARVAGRSPSTALAPELQGPSGDSSLLFRQQITDHFGRRQSSVSTTSSRPLRQCLSDESVSRVHVARACGRRPSLPSRVQSARPCLPRHQPQPVLNPQLPHV